MKSLICKLHQMLSGRTPVRRSASKNRAAVTPENLESRQVLSVSSVWMSGTMVVVKANDSATSVEVTKSGSNIVIRDVNASKTWTYGESSISAVEFQGGKGNDRFVNNVRSLPVRGFGGDGNDYLEGYDGNDVFVGGNGNDTIRGYGGNDKMWGEAGADSLSGGDGNDELMGGSGDDTMDGGNDTDRLFGEDGNDFLDGGAGSDEMYGGNGKDNARLSIAGEKTDAEVVVIRVPGGSPQQTNKCGPNSAWRVVKANGGIATEQQIIDAASERSLISRWAMGTSGSTLVDAMNANRRGLGSYTFSLKTKSSFDTLLSHVKAGKPVVALIASGGTESVKVGFISYRIPTLHWIAVDGFDASRNVITYTDTDGKRYEQSYGDFNAVFDWSASSLVRTFLQGVGVVPRTFIV